MHICHYSTRQLVVRAVACAAEEGPLLLGLVRTR